MSSGENREWLQAERERVRAHKRELEGQQERERQLLTELAVVETALEAHEPRRPLPLLDRVRVASPCKQAWSDMVGDDRARHCLACEKTVYDISAMSRESAEAFLQGVVGASACVRIYRRADGTILTADDCPVGARSARRKKKLAVLAGAGAIALAGYSAAAASGPSCRARGGDPVGRSVLGPAPWFGDNGGRSAVMGEMAIDPAPQVAPTPSGTRHE